MRQVMGVQDDFFQQRVNSADLRGGGMTFGAEAVFKPFHHQ